MNRPRQHALGFLALVLYLTLLAAASGPDAAPPNGFDGVNRPAPPEAPADVALCDLDENPTTYDGRLVRVSAVLVDYREGEAAWLYATVPCRLGTDATTILPVDDDTATRRPFVLARIRRQEGRVPHRMWVVAVGRMRSARAPSAFEIEQFERIEPLPDDAPWPWPDEHCSQ